MPYNTVTAQLLEAYNIRGPCPVSSLSSPLLLLLFILTVHHYHHLPPSLHPVFNKVVSGATPTCLSLHPSLVYLFTCPCVCLYGCLIVWLNVCILSIPTKDPLKTAHMIDIYSLVWDTRTGFNQIYSCDSKEPSHSRQSLIAHDNTSQSPLQRPECSQFIPTTMKEIKEKPTIGHVVVLAWPGFN